MSDFNSSLPVRTEANGDVAVKLVDGTITSQSLEIDASGKITVKLDDAAGSGLTSQVNGTQQALDVGINVAGVQIDPRDVRALTTADAITATIQDGGNSITVDAVNLDIRDLAFATDKVDVGGSVVALDATTLAALESITVQNSSGASAVNIQDGGNSITVDGTVAVSNFPSTVDTNFGAAGASTLRTASEIGNATGAADFNNGATGAQTLRVAANLAVAGSDVSALNPIPVTVTNSSLGDEVNDYKAASAIAGNASDNHDYSITSAKTFKGRMFWASASGKMKAVVQISPDGTTFTTKFVGFNSTANPNIEISLDNLTLSETGSGSKIRIIMTNLDKQSQDMYSTICGTEV